MDTSVQQCKIIRGRGTIKTLKANYKLMTENTNPKPFNISRQKFRLIPAVYALSPRRTYSYGI